RGSSRPSACLRGGQRRAGCLLCRNVRRLAPFEDGDGAYRQAPAWPLPVAGEGKQEPRRGVPVAAGRPARCHPPVALRAGGAARRYHAGVIPLAKLVRWVLFALLAAAVGGAL